MNEPLVNVTLLLVVATLGLVAVTLWAMVLSTRAWTSVKSVLCHLGAARVDSFVLERKVTTRLVARSIGLSALMICLLSLVNSQALSAPGQLPTQCGPVLVQTFVVPATNLSDHNELLRVSAAGKILEETTDYRISNVQCELNVAGATPVLLVTTYSGGQHCCNTVLAFVTQPFRRVLNHAGGGAPGTGFALRRGKGPQQVLVLNDSYFDDFDDLAHAQSPSAIPLVACFTGDRFDDCTKEFPVVIGPSFRTSVQ